MSKLKDVTINEKHYTFHHFTGVVVDEKKWSTTSVSGGGGGGSGYSHQGTGFSNTSSVSISSTTTEHDQFILEDSEGNEDSFKFSNLNIACRKGNIMSVVWCIKKGKNTGPYWFVHNHNTRNTFKLKDYDKTILVKQWITNSVNFAAFLFGIYVFKVLYDMGVLDKISGGSYFALLIGLPVVSLFISGFFISFKNKARLSRFERSQDHKDIFTILNKESIKFKTK